MQRSLFLCLAGLLAASAALAEDFWTSKEYMQWTDEEVKKLMTNSPWAKDLTINVPLTALGRGAQPPENAAPTDVQGGGGGGRGRRGGGGGGGEGGSSAEAMVTLNISFRSALPFRKALVRSRLGSGAAVPPEAAHLISKEPDEYVVVVTGLPARMAPLVQDPALKEKSIIRAGKKSPLTAKNMDVQRRTQSVDVFYTFPKSQLISADDKEVEFVFHIGQIEAKKKFNLKEMVYNGKLEL